MNNLPLKQIYEESEFKSILEKESSFLLFKHSLTCPISRGAFDQFTAYLEEHNEINGYYLTVQDSRPLSNFIANHFAIKHESPQIFYIKSGEVQWHTSHGEITKETIEKVTL
ncbi:bacillithiol system redox-active protein YtxJ [Caldibacillus thermoamylovorans]|nr:bacillithiol system redox-active protein YtxJ [Caldibacillus thermoamylovorans]